eukprot:275549_1
MSALQPPHKRRKLTDPNPTHHATISNPHCNQFISFPDPGPEPNDTPQCRNGTDKFGIDWSNFVEELLPHTTHTHSPPNSNLQFDIQSVPRSESIFSSTMHIESECKTNEHPSESLPHITDLQQQNEALQHQNTTLQEQLQQAQKNERKYRTLYDSEHRDKDRYKLRLKALAQMIKTGQRPYFNRVCMNKMDPTCTQQIHQIKCNIKMVHNTSKKKHDITVDINGYTQHKWMPKKSLSQTIKKYYKHNLKHNPSKPEMWIGKSHMPYHFVLKSYRIKKDSHRIKALSTGYQRGLKTIIDVPKGTVIGQYVGVEYMMSEWQSVFSNTNEEAVRNTYAFDVTIKVPSMDKKGKCVDYKEEEMVIDGYGLRETIMEHQRIGKGGQCPYSAHLLYINDCRVDIAAEYPSKEDRKHWTVDFVEAVINGYPAVFLITRCDVKKGDELMSYYCETYDVALKQQTEYERMQNCMITLVDNSILHGVDLSGDVWTLE